jgi:hypothetical protein
MELKEVFSSLKDTALLPMLATYCLCIDPVSIGRINPVRLNLINGEYTVGNFNSSIKEIIPPTLLCAIDSNKHFAAFGLRLKDTYCGESLLPKSLNLLATSMYNLATNGAPIDEVVLLTGFKRKHVEEILLKIGAPINKRPIPKNGTLFTLERSFF